MTSKEIQQEICKTEVLKFNIPCENVCLGMAEADVLSLNKSGYLSEFEVKISRSDFIADFKKDKWRLFDAKVERSIPNYFWYVCPIGLIDEEEIPSYAGLVYVSIEGVEIIKKAKILHKYKKPMEKILQKFCRVTTERVYLGACRMTYENNLRKEYYNQY